MGHASVLANIAIKFTLSFVFAWSNFRQRGVIAEIGSLLEETSLCLSPEGRRRNIFAGDYMLKSEPRGDQRGNSSHQQNKRGTIQN